MIYFATETTDEYARAALASEGLQPDAITASGRILTAYFPLDCANAVRLAHDRVKRRGNVLFEVYDYGQDLVERRTYLRFGLKVQS